MARPKAKEPEKDPWFWVSSCSNPLEVTDEHVKTVYRINVLRCSNKQHKYVRILVFEYSKGQKQSKLELLILAAYQHVFVTDEIANIIRTAFRNWEKRNGLT